MTRKPKRKTIFNRRFSPEELKREQRRFARAKQSGLFDDPNIGLERGSPQYEPKGGRGWKKTQMSAMADSLAAERRLDSAEQLHRAASTPPPPSGLLGRISGWRSDADATFGKLEKKIRLVRQDLTYRSKRTMQTGTFKSETPPITINPSGTRVRMNPAGPEGRSAESPPFRRFGKLLSEERDKLLRKAEETLKHHRETGRWRVVDVPGKPGTGESQKTIRYKTPIQKESRGYSIPKAKLRKKAFEPNINIKESRKVTPEGIDWLLHKEKQLNPNRATNVKGYAHVSLPAIALAGVAGRLEYLKKKNPERYKKERNIATAAGVAYGVYRSAKFIRNTSKGIEGFLKGV